MLTAERRRSRIVEGSCSCCRKRRVKCDLARPSCARCLAEDQQCDYSSLVPIRWVGGSALRGRHAPGNLPGTSLPTTPRPPSPSPDTLHDESLVHYFTTAVLPRFQMSDETIVIDGTDLHRNQAIQQAMQAVARAHFCMNAKATTQQTASVQMRSRSQALQSFRAQLQDGAIDDQAAQRLFPIVVLLCMLDGMLDPSQEENAATFHLKGGHAMLSRWPNILGNMLLADGLQAHLLSVFATMDLVHALLSGVKPYFDPTTWPMLADLPCWWGRLPTDHPQLTLLKAHAEAAVLGSTVFSHLPSLDGMRLAAKCVPSLQASFDAPCSMTGLQSISDSHWKIFCSLYSTCGTIYLLRALRLRPMDDKSVQLAIRRGADMLVREALPGMMAHCVILPILVIGAHCILAQDQLAVLRALSPSVSHLSFGNLPLMEIFLRQTWEKIDVGASWWDIFADISTNLFLV